MTSFPSDQDATGRSFGVDELDLVSRALENGTLFAPKGRFVKTLEREFSNWVGNVMALACSSGSAAMHTAIAGIDPEPGDEIITTPITDIGALTPVLYQGAVPVFADVDPDSGNVTAETIAQRVSERTRAVVVTHLFGNPVDVSEVRSEIGSIPVIEDCAQAFGAEVGGRRVGTLGSIGSFSLQQGKHITTGEGGLVVTSDGALAKRMRLFINKAWDYDNPSDHDFLALNYRMSELQGAVGLAQLRRIDRGIETRRANASVLGVGLEQVEGVIPVPSLSGARHSYWRYCVLVDPDAIPGGTDALGKKLREIGVPAAPRYIQKPAFRTGLFIHQRTFGQSRWPFTMAREEALDYSRASFPGTFRFLERVLVLPWNERFTANHIEQISSAVSEAAAALTMEAA